MEAPGWAPSPSAATRSEVGVLQLWLDLFWEGGAAEPVGSRGFRGLNFGHFP